MKIKGCAFFDSALAGSMLGVLPEVPMTQGKLLHRILSLSCLCVFVLADLSGCAGQQRELMVDRQMEELHREIREIRRNMSGVDTQIEELQGQYALMEDKIAMTAQARAPQDYYAQNTGMPAQAQRRYTHDSALPVVNLSPHASPNQPGYAEIQDSAPANQGFNYQTFDDSGRIVDVPKSAVSSAPVPTQRDLADVNAMSNTALAAVPAQAPAPAPVQPAVPAPVPVVNSAPPIVPTAPAAQGKDAATLKYENAFASFRKGDLDAAQNEFKDFVKQYPNHDLADNAIYWWAECRYHRRDFLRSLHLFQRILEEHPIGNKVPDAMLKMGLCLVNLGQREEGLGILDQVAGLYPASPAAQVAERRRIALSDTKK